MPEEISVASDNDSEEEAVIESEPALSDGYTIDYITGEKRVKETPKEQVRQFIAKALEKQYNIALEDMEADFSVGNGKSRRIIDIAIFHHQKDHNILNLSRAVICRPLPASGRNATRLRDYEEAKKDLLILQEIMEQVESCEYGLWTNKLDIFYLEREKTRFDVRLKPIADWPLAGESEKLDGPTSSVAMYRADKDMLRVAFRRCHKFIHGNEGMPKDTAFWQFLYLIFCKMHDEDPSNTKHRFWVGMTWVDFRKQGPDPLERLIWGITGKRVLPM